MGNKSPSIPMRYQPRTASRSSGAPHRPLRISDLKSYTRWDDYSKARDGMFLATDTAWAPWYVARSDDKRRARLNIISHLLSNIRYKKVPHEKVKLPKRHVAAARKQTDYSYKLVPEVH